MEGSLLEMRTAALEGSGCGIAIAELDRDEMPIVFANEAFYSFTGGGPDSIRSLSDLLQNSECFPHGIESLRSQVSTNPNSQVVCKGLQKNGRETWIKIVFSPIVTSEEKGRYTVATVIDETDHHQELDTLREERDQVEERLIDRTRALERINQDLEGFTFSVSHDLRAPLRAIMGFSKALVEDHGRAVDSEMRQTLDRINAAAGRMATIIEDLLTFSRLGRKEFTRRKINLTEMAEAVATEIKRRHPNRDTQFEIEKDMMIDGDPTLIRMALENLLDNASKFTSKIEGGLIQVGRARPRTFFVRDNGAGFDPQFSDKLFRPFERLHSASDFPGTGIGLANVQRIVERHGGKIWAEGKPNEGATFFFSL